MGRCCLRGSECWGNWGEYLASLLNVTDGREAEIAAVEGGRMPGNRRSMNEPIGSKEVVAVVKCLKAGKAGGMDCIAWECIRSRVEMIGECLVRLFNERFESGCVPGDWKKACTVPLYQGKGDIRECGSYRGISLLSVVGKVYGYVSE